MIFSSIAFYGSVKSRDKARGIGVVLLLWFYFALIFDGLILLVLFAFSDYPLEKLTLLLSSLNPIDLGRISHNAKDGCKRFDGLYRRLYKDFLEAYQVRYIRWVCCLCGWPFHYGRRFVHLSVKIYNYRQFGVIIFVYNIFLYYSQEIEKP